MNLKKLLTLSAAALMVGTVAVGCSDNSQETLTAAAEYVWQMYRATDDSSVTASFDVVNKVLVGDETVSVTWTLEVTGSQDAFSLTKKNDNFSTVNVGYYDGKVTEASTVKLVPTFTLGKKSITLKDVYAEEAAKHAIDFNTPVLTINTHEDWDKAADGDSITVKGTVVDVIAKESGSSSAGSLYMVDDKGNGYYIYKPTSTGAKAGDLIIATGAKTIYNGQEETKAGGSYQVIGEGTTIPVVNASADFAAATSNKVDGELANKYQNIPVKLEKCTPIKVDGSYYWFTVGEGKTQFNIYENNYFLNADQIAAWKTLFNDALEKGYTFTVEGISTVYSKAYQIYPSSIAPHVLTKEAELSVDDKHALVKGALEGAILESYNAAKEIAFEIPSYATVALEVTSPAENATVSIKDGKIVVTPTPVETTNKVKATVTIGESTKEVELTIKTEALKYDGFVGTAKVSDLVSSKTPETKDVTVKAATYDASEEVDVTFSVKNLFKDHSAVYFGKSIDGDVLTISVPEGYVISKLEIEQYGTYDNFKFHKGADATGEEIAHTLTGNLLEVSPNVAQVTIDNPSSFNCSFYDVKVTVAKTEVGLTNTKLLGFAGTSVAYGDGEATVDGVKMKYTQVSCYTNRDDATKNDGLQMRNKTADGGVASSIQTASAIESGIKSVKLTFAATKSTYDNEGMMKFEFSNNADFSEAETVLMNTVKGTKEYEVKASVATYKYVRITNNLGYTTYWDSIVIDY